MPLKMTNEVSVMDIVAIGGLLVGGLAVFFGVNAEVQTHTVQIAENTRAIVRVETRVEREQRMVLDALEAQAQETRSYRTEAQSGLQRIEDKLDKVIERELDEKNDH